MGLLSSCCCCCTVRQGCIISAKYTLVYFAVFSLLSGTMIVQDIVGLAAGNNGTDDSSGASKDVSQTTGGGFVKTIPTSEPNARLHSIKILKSSERGQMKGKMSTDPTIENMGFIQRNDPTVVSRTRSRASYLRLFSISLLVLDFIFEVAGIFVSLLLLIGLRKERKSLLLPWLIVVPFHTVLDACQAVNIMIDDCPGGAGPSHACHQSFSSFVFLFTDLLFNFISIYIILIVYSQYQEYKAGRGTAAYDGLMARNSDASNFVLNQTSLNSSHRNSQSQNRRSYGFDKSDIWCDGLMMERVNDSSPPTKVSSGSDREVVTESGGAHSSTSVTNSTPANANATSRRHRFVQIDLTDDANSEFGPGDRDTNRRTDEEKNENGIHRVGHSVRFNCDQIQFEHEGSQPSTSFARARNDHHPRRNSAVHSDRKGKNSAKSNSHLLEVPTMAQGARRTSAPSLKQNRSASLNVDSRVGLL